MAANSPLLPEKFAKVKQVEADAPVDSSPCWEQGSVGTPRIGLARVVTNERELFRGRSRFATADMIHPLDSALGETQGVAWHEHLEIA